MVFPLKLKIFSPYLMQILKYVSNIDQIWIRDLPYKRVFLNINKAIIVNYQIVVINYLLTDLFFCFRIRICLNTWTSMLEVWIQKMPNYFYFNSSEVFLIVINEEFCTGMLNLKICSSVKWENSSWLILVSYFKMIYR